MKRESVIEAAVQGLLSNRQAADLLGVQPRQVKRLKVRYRAVGAAGMVDGRSGVRPRRRVAKETVEQICRLKATRYADFSVRHFYEYLQQDEGIKDVSYSFVLRWLQRHGLAERAKRRGQYRRRRERRPMVGMRVHLDSSTHRWLGKRHPAWDLTVALDDADGRILSMRFAPEEGTMTSLQALFDVLTRYGRFDELYTDRGSHFCQTSDREKGPDNTQHTEVCRVLRALAIRPLWARSPQARGRSERVFRTLQDRLINELKLLGICSYEAANSYLERVFTKKYNERFAVRPKLDSSAFRALPYVDLHLLLSIHTTRAVRHDFTVLFKGTVLQLPRTVSHSLPGRKVTVHTFVDCSLGVSHDGRLIACFDSQGRALRLPQTLSPATDTNQPRPSLPLPNHRPPDSSDPDFWTSLLQPLADQSPAAVVHRKDLFQPDW